MGGGGRKLTSSSASSTYCKREGCMAPRIMGERDTLSSEEVQPFFMVVCASSISCCQIIFKSSFASLKTLL